MKDFPQVAVFHALYPGENPHDSCDPTPRCDEAKLRAAGEELGGVVVQAIPAPHSWISTRDGWPDQTPWSDGTMCFWVYHAQRKRVFLAGWETHGSWGKWYCWRTCERLGCSGFQEGTGEIIGGHITHWMPCKPPEAPIGHE